ncbi:type 1 glutamine amidotransferase [Hansschlegelia quercus]|uniref:Type 1 glutamine amidotransferase n=1 Tax=Hansschlegelia quercus TaxID=2528245 RepID=A0A4Q9GHX9_9HYPH|nr:type 1 glutamine amidotransferase [Hansschlegelia quercus]TBN48296.1 type 1 glutamine amidotransferase [Hansschlegelia quercus]
MTRPLRILVAEGGTVELRERHAAQSGRTPSAFYADILTTLGKDLGAEIETEICFPADEGAVLPDAAGLEGYDGVAITGSGLNLWKGERSSLAQVDFARAVFDAGVPIFGSCWGLQVAAAAAGGAVTRNPQGREVGIARSIRVTEAGRAAGLHQGRREVFDAPAIHSDEVSVLPEGATVTATNELCAVQAAEIRHGKGVFWGVQFHPEYTFAELGGILTRITPIMVEEGFFRAPEEAGKYVADLVALDEDPGRKDVAWRLGVAPSVLDPKVRRTELINWLGRVTAEASARGRA